MDQRSRRRRWKEAEEHARAARPETGKPTPEQMRLLADVLYARGDFDPAETQRCRNSREEITHPVHRQVPDLHLNGTALNVTHQSRA